MKLFILDTETTGFGHNALPIQVAGFIVNENLEIERVINWYCDVDGDIPADAVAVHHITSEKLKILSKGKTLEDYLENSDFREMAEDMVFVGYNVSFDLRMLRQALIHHELADIKFGKPCCVLPKSAPANICIMKTLNKSLGYSWNNKLGNLVEYHLNEYSKEDIVEMLQESLNKYNMSLEEGESLYHNALFDAYVTLLLLKKYRHFYCI